MVTPQVSREDHAKFEALYLSNYKPIYAHVHRRTLQSSEVPDIVSEVFAIAWRRFGDLPASPRDRLWLFGVAHNCLLGHHRRSSLVASTAAALTPRSPAESNRTSRHLGQSSASPGESGAPGTATVRSRGCTPRLLGWTQPCRSGNRSWMLGECRRVTHQEGEGSPPNPTGR